MRGQAKTRQAAVAEVDDEDDDLFGTNDNDEDFNLFDNNSNSKSQTTLILDKAKSISEASPPATPHQRHHNNINGYPFFPATSVPKSAAIGLFANSGKQNISGLVNLTGFTQGVLNGTVFLGNNNSITVYNR